MRFRPGGLGYDYSQVFGGGVVTSGTAETSGCLTCASGIPSGTGVKFSTAKIIKLFAALWIPSGDTSATYGRLRDMTAAVTIYELTGLDPGYTIYSGNPLASYNLPANNTLGVVAREPVAGVARFSVAGVAI